MRLSHFILQNLEPILVEWEKFAATLVPASQRADQAMLRDHVKKMLETIAADLARPESAHDQAEKSKGHRPDTKTPATTHGVERLELGFSLVSAMAEYRALRASVTRLWQDAHLANPVSKTANEDIIPKVRGSTPLGRTNPLNFHNFLFMTPTANHGPHRPTLLGVKRTEEAVIAPTPPSSLPGGSDARPQPSRACRL